MTEKYQRKFFYSPNELMIGGGLIKENGKPNTALYNQWLYRGIFKAQQEADGPGTVSIYDFFNILHVAVVVRLREFYLPLKQATRTAKKIIEFRRKNNKEKCKTIVIFLGEKGGLEIKMGDDNPEIDVIRINLTSIENEVIKRLEGLGDGEGIGKYFTYSTEE